MLLHDGVRVGGPPIDLRREFVAPRVRAHFDIRHFGLGVGERLAFGAARGRSLPLAQRLHVEAGFEQRGEIRGVSDPDRPFRAQCSRIFKRRRLTPGLPSARMLASMHGQHDDVVAVQAEVHLRKETDSGSPDVSRFGPPDPSAAFHLPPVAFAIQAREIANTSTRRDRLDVGEIANERLGA